MGGKGGGAMRRTRRLLWIQLTSVLVAWWALTGKAGSWDADATTSDLRLELEAIRTRYGLPAVGGAIVDEQGLREVAVTGVRRLGDPTPATDADTFSIMSCGKAMTATAVAILVEEGRLSWGEGLADLFPELSGTMDPRFADVTVAHLLAHRAGLSDEVLGAHLQSALPVTLPLEEQRRWIVGESLRTPSGSVGAYEYSTVGYVVAGAVIEKVTGQPWESVMNDRLFAPLGMTTTGYDPPVGDLPGWLWWHDFVNGQIIPVSPGPDPVLTVGRPAGGIHVTFADWARFARAHLLGAGGVSSIVSAESFQTLHTPWPGPAAPYAEGYALGWHIMSIHGQHVLAHGGAADLRAAIQIWPDQGTAILVFVNCDDPPGRLGMDAALEALQRRAGL